MRPPTTELFSLVVALLVMALAVYAVPFPGSLILLGAVALGALLAKRWIRRRADAER